MKTLQKFGGFAALYLAAVNLMGMCIFLAVLDYMNITDPLQKVTLLVEKQIDHLFNQSAHVRILRGLPDRPVFGAYTIRLKDGAPATMQMAAVTGIIWAGSLIASGMVANAGIAPVVALYSRDPQQAALAWQNIEAVSGGSGQRQW